MKYSTIYNEPKEVVDNLHRRSEKQYYELFKNTTKEDLDAPRPTK